MEEIYADADARRLTPTVREAALSPHASLRAAAVRALGALEEESVTPLLELALADREPGIRLDAARAIARHPGYQPAGRAAVLLGAYAAAPTVRERAALLGVLADIHPNAKAPWLGRSLTSTDALEQQAACLALQRLASRGHAPLPADVSSVLELVQQGPAETAGLCASMFAEPVARETARGAGLSSEVVSALASLARSADLGAATLATQALAADGGELAAKELSTLVGSSAPGIAFESVRGLRQSLAPAALKAAVDRELTSLSGAARSGRAGVMLELLDALELRPDTPEAAAAAARVLRATSDALPPSASESIRREHALLHCAAAKLSDATRHWPKELFSCGHGPMPEAVRDGWIADAFARAEGSHDLRAVQLTRLFEKGPAALRIKVLEASATLPVKHATALLRSGLRHSDPLVLAAAAREIAARPGLRAPSQEDRLGASELIEAAPRAAQNVAAATAWLLAARSVARAHEAKIDDSGALSAPIKSAPGGSSRSNPLAADASVQALENTRASAPPAALIERVTQLARHSIAAVRVPALALLSEWEAPLPTEIEAVRNPLVADRMPRKGTLFHVKLLTTAGAIELELDTDHAPVAAVRFVELVRSGALDGLPVAQVAFGRAVSFSPPEGAQLRHEQSAETVGRGSVLLQDHGRDALGPGFALVLSRAPSLDRRAVAIGRILDGLDVADALLPIDTILEAQVSTEQRR